MIEFWYDLINISLDTNLRKIIIFLKNYEKSSNLLNIDNIKQFIINHKKIYFQLWKFNKIPK